MKRYDAIVIGGGPAGATAALLLARAGWSIAVVERSPYPRGKVCGEYIAPPALALLHDMGVGHIVDEAGPEVRRIAVWNHGTRVTAVMPAYGDERARYGRALSREACDARLLQHAVEAGAELWQPYRAIELRGKAGAFECDVERAGAVATLHARCIIAAHGSWEAGRLPTQVKRASAKPDDLFGFKAYFSHVALARDLLPLMSFAGGYAGMVNTSGGRVNLSCCVRRDALERVRALYPGRPAGDA
ncbi:MAG: NAD(P)/FAD-dependent oxidoreductase, partial [Rhodospirillaceae bacterium]